MKILFVTTISNTVNAFLIPHIRMLVKQGHQVDVAFNIVQPVNSELESIGCKVYNINFKRSPLKRSNLESLNAIKKIVTNEKYELVHCHTPIAAFITRIACRNIKGIKMLYTAHGFHFFRGASAKNWLFYYPIEKLSSRWTDGILTMNIEDSKSASDFKTKRCSAFQTHGVGIDLEKFKPQTLNNKTRLRREYGYSNDQFILIYAGELSFRKHQDLIIDTANILSKKIPKLKILLAGEGPLLDKYKNHAVKLGLGDVVEFLGYRKDIHKLMMVSDIAVSSSRQEGLPVNIMEAMATGLPLVVSNCRGNRDLVYNAKNGFVVDLNDYQGFSHAIEELYKSPELRKEFSQNSIKLVKRYGIENVLKELDGIYKKYLPTVK